MGIFCKHAVQQNQIWFITLQQAIEFARVTFDFLFGGLVRLDILVTDRQFHGCTCRYSYRRGRRRGDALCTASCSKHTSARCARQSRCEKYFAATTLNGKHNSACVDIPACSTLLCPQGFRRHSCLCGFESVCEKTHGQEWLCYRQPKLS